MAPRFTVYTASDLMNLPPPPQLVRLDGAWLEIAYEPDRWSYLIEWRRIDSAPKLVRWLLHLSQKNWWTCEHTVQLIEVFSRRAGFHPYGV